MKVSTEELKAELKFLEVANPRQAAIYRELLALREAQPIGFTHRSEIRNMQATGLYLRAWPADRRMNEQEGYTIPLYTVPPALAVANQQLVVIANHIAGAVNALPDEWQDWADELVSNLRCIAVSDDKKFYDSQYKCHSCSKVFAKGTGHYCDKGKDA